MSEAKKDKRKTQQQALIRGLFEHSGRPLSAQELLDAASSIQPGIGIATIYRGIKQLLEDNALVAVDIPGTAPRYERTGLHHHHHFLCQKCDRVYPVSGCPGHLEKLVPPGFKMNAHKIVIEGNCAECH
jgi:Fur family transcriptional regulator, ferric uptake regulator